MTEASSADISEEINLRPSVEYFPHAAPETFKNMKCIAANAHADILFGLRAEFVNNLDTETGVVTVEKTHAEIAKYHVKSGESSVFPMDPKLVTEDLRRIIDFYVLNDYLGVMVTYNRIDYVFKQHLLVFDHKLKMARKTYERKLELNALSFDVNVGLGEIGRGRIVVYGSRGPMDGEREVVAYSLSADPRPWDVVKYPDINLTTQIANFVTLLKADFPAYDIFSSGIFLKDGYMYFLIKQQERSIISLHTIGRMRMCEKEEKSKKPCKDRFKMLIATGHIRYLGGISSADLDLSVQRGRSVWLAFSPPDYDQLNTLSWRFYYKILPYIAINVGLRVSVVDRGWTLRRVLNTLRWFYGPSMTPTIAPPNAIQIYNLDLKNLVYKKVDYQPKFGESGATGYYPFVMDTDARGGLLMMATPEKENKQLNVRYFSPPHQAETLSKLCENMIYRKYPEYGRNETLRRGLGICDYRWKL